jgi:acetoin utilization deacetylase AcuC-like enzyme
MWHDTGNAQLSFPGSAGALQPEPFVEGAEPKRRLRNLLAVSGLDRSLRPISARLCDEQDLLRWHERGYVERIRTLSEHAGARLVRQRRSAPAATRSRASLSAAALLRPKPS